MSTVDSLFAVAYGNKFDMNKMTPASPETGVAFVGRKGGLTGHSGVSGYVDLPRGVTPYPAGLLTVALGGSRLLSSYVQQRPFVTAQNVAVLTPKDEAMPLMHRLYYAMCIRHNSFRYTAFGREANRTLGTIVLPDNVPDWVDDAELPSHEGLRQSLGDPVALGPPFEWGWFRLGDLFNVTRGKYIPAADQRSGETPVVTSSRENNGVSKWLDVDPLHYGGQITVARNGSVGEAFYQDEPFFASDDVFVLDPIEFTLTPMQALFVVTVIRVEQYRYSYGRKLRIPVVTETMVRLPTKANEEPDWQYMESVMRGLPFSAMLKT